MDRLFALVSLADVALKVMRDIQFAYSTRLFNKSRADNSDGVSEQKLRGLVDFVVQIFAVVQGEFGGARGFADFVKAICAMCGHVARRWRRMSEDRWQLGKVLPRIMTSREEYSPTLMALVSSKT